MFNTFLLYLLSFLFLPEKYVVNINSLPAVVEILDTDILYMNAAAFPAALSVKNYIEGGETTVTDTDSLLRCNFNTGFANNVTALNLKNFVAGSASPVTNSTYFAIIRGGHAYKVTGLSLKSYLNEVAIDYLPIIVMAGQSNMEGENDGTTNISSPYTGALSNAKIYYKNTTSGTTNGAIQTLQYGTNNNWRTDHLNDVGPEIGLGYHLPILLSHQIGIIKYSLGGSVLCDDGVSVRSAGLWDVNGSASRAGSFGLHFPILVNNFVKPAIQKFIEAGYTPKIIAFSWCQGEGDATFLYGAQHYEERLTELLDEFKNQIRGVEPNVDTMHVVISRIHNNFSPARTYQNEIRTALVNVATNYLNGHWINTDSYPTRTDDNFTHWTRQAQAANHGQDIANLIATFYIP